MHVQREMRMVDYVRELDNILNSTGRKVLDNVEKGYLKTIAALEKQAKEESRKK